MKEEGLGHHPDKGRSNMHKLMSKDNESLEMRTKPVKKHGRAAGALGAGRKPSSKHKPVEDEFSSGCRGRWSYREQGPPSHPRGGR